jgi:hypothetical protein
MGHQSYYADGFAVPISSIIGVHCARRHALHDNYQQKAVVTISSKQ